MSFSEQGVPTLGVFLEDDLSLSATEVGALVAMLGLGRLVSFYAAGRAVDVRGERRVLLVGRAGTGVFVALAAGVGYTAMLALFFVAGSFSPRPRPRRQAGLRLGGAAPPQPRDGPPPGGRPGGGLAAAAVLPALAGLDELACEPAPGGSGRCLRRPRRVRPGRAGAAGRGAAGAGRTGARRARHAAVRPHDDLGLPPRRRRSTSSSRSSPSTPASAPARPRRLRRPCSSSCRRRA